MISLTHHTTGSNLAQELRSEPEEMAYLLIEYSDVVTPRNLEELCIHLNESANEDEKTSLRTVLENILRVL